MADLKKKIELDLAGNISARSRRFGRDLAGFAQDARGSFGQVGNVLSKTSSQIDRLGNRYTAMATAFATGATVRNLTKLEERFTRLGIQAKISDEEVRRLRDQIYKTALDTRIDPSELFSSVEKIVEKTGDLDFAVENLDNLGHAIQASGSRGKDIGALTAELKKLGIVTNEGVLKALDTFVIQGEAGAFTLENLSSQSERLVAAYAALGRTGPDAVKEISALAQVARQATGGPEQAATAVEAVIRTLNDVEKRKLIRQGGIKILDQDALEQGIRRMRSVPDILREIIVKLKGDEEKLGQIFDSEALKAISNAVGDFKNKGNFDESFDKFLPLSGTGQTILENSARAAETLSAALTNVSTAFEKFADANLTTHLQTLADTLNSIDPESFERVMNALTVGVAGVGGVIALNKVGQAVTGLGRMGVGLYSGVRSLRGRLGGVAGKGPLAAGAADVQRVFVVNMGAGGLGDGGGAVNDRVRNRRGLGGRGRARFGGIGRGGRGLVRGAGALSLAFGAYDIGSTIAEGGDAEEIGGAIGATGGTLAGVAAGAAIGSAVPVVGTIAGAIIGGVLAYLGANVGEEIGRDVGRAIAGKAADEAAGAGGREPLVVRVEAEPGTRAYIPGPGPHSIQGDVGFFEGWW